MSSDAEEFILKRTFKALIISKVKKQTLNSARGLRVRNIRRVEGSSHSSEVQLSLILPKRLRLNSLKDSKWENSINIETSSLRKLSTRFQLWSVNRSSQLRWKRLLSIPHHFILHIIYNGRRDGSLHSSLVQGIYFWSHNSNVLCSYNIDSFLACGCDSGRDFWTLLSSRIYISS